MNNTEDRKRIVKSPTRNGKPCKYDSTTEKYISSGNCVACSIKQSDLRTERTLIERDKKLQQRLAALPHMEIMVRRDCRLPIVYQIPAPPQCIANRRWL